MELFSIRIQRTFQLVSTVGKEIDTELSFLAHPVERPFDTKYKKQPEAGRKKLIP